MAEYTSSIEGFQRAMEWSLTGPAEKAQEYAEGTATSSFYHMMNGNRLDYDVYVKGLAEWRSKVSDYKPKVHQFLRTGDQLAARMTGTIKVEGVPTVFESFMFAEVDDSGKLKYLIERSIWGPEGKDPEHGVN